MKERVWHEHLIRFTPTRVRQSLGGHTMFGQEKKGLPLAGGYIGNLKTVMARNFSWEESRLLFQEERNSTRLEN